MIYFFTGTGNSLSVARRLAEALGEGLASIPQQPDGPVVCEDELCGVVFPTYAHTFPAMVREFIARLRPAEGAYVFLLPTFGNPKSAGIAERGAADARALGLPVAYSQGVLMGDNWLPSYDAAEQMAVDKNVEGQVEAIIADLQARRAFVRPETEEEHAHFARATAGTPDLNGETARGLFTVNDACVGCGICAQVCPSGTIVLEGDRAQAKSTEDAGASNVADAEGGKPAWRDGNCQWCFACINWCPEGAIGFMRLPEKNPGARYRNPAVTVTDIIAANNQGANQ